MGNSNCDKCGHDTKSCACEKQRPHLKLSELDLTPETPFQGPEANSIQIGGSHYKSEYQHWDWTIDIQLGQLEYAASKYLARFGKKEQGVEGLQKSIHYLRKAGESFHEGRYKNTCMCVSKGEEILGLERTTRFLLINEVNDPKMWNVFIGLTTWTSPHHLQSVINNIEEIIGFAKDAQGRAQPRRSAKAT